MSLYDRDNPEHERYREMHQQRREARERQQFRPTPRTEGKRNG
jgi:hypothetical protein